MSKEINELRPKTSWTDNDEDDKNEGREKLSLVDWLRSKTPALAVEVNSDPEAKQFLEDNQVMMVMMNRDLEVEHFDSSILIEIKS